MPPECPICRSALDSRGQCPACSPTVSRPAAGRPSRVRILIILLVTLYVDAFLLYILWPTHRPAFQALLERFIPIQTYAVKAPPPTVKPSQNNRPILTLDELEALRRNFETKQFDRLNRALGEIQGAFEKDSAQEYRGAFAFEIFETSREDYLPLLDAWVAATPDQFAPYLARAAYYSDRGWTARGAKYAAETSRDQFRQMRYNFAQAEDDLGAALRRNPRLLPAYRIRLDILNAEGKDADEDRVFAQALALFPDSYLLYSTMLRGKRPRWGGSYAEMEALADSACRQAAAKPEMYFLYGKIYYDQAELRRWKKDYRRAIDLCDKALEYGENGQVYEERAWINLDRNEYSRALADVNRSLALRPLAESAFRLRAMLEVDLKQPEEAKRDIAMAARLDPGNPAIGKWSTWAAKHYLWFGNQVFKTDLSQALADYDTALEFDPQCAGAYYWRGVANSKLGRPDLALANWRRSIEIAPKEIETYRRIDGLLAAEGRWDEIIGYWDRFLAAVPDCADGYLERAGTYRHKGDMARAMADLQHSCALGNQNACKLYKKRN